MAVEEIDDRSVLEHDGGDLGVDLLALGKIERRARAVEQVVDGLVAITCIIEWLLAAIKAEDVAVRIGAAAPRQYVRLEVAFVGHVERGSELG